MTANTTQLLSLPDLARVLALPEKWLKEEADAGRLPHLRIGKRYRFNCGTVLRILSARAAKGEEVAGAR